MVIMIILQVCSIIFFYIATLKSFSESLGSRFLNGKLHEDPWSHSLLIVVRCLVSSSSQAGNPFTLEEVAIKWIVWKLHSI